MTIEEQQLHDRYAEAAMHSLIRQLFGIKPVSTAQLAFDIADAMLDERRRRAEARAENSL